MTFLKGESPSLTIFAKKPHLRYLTGWRQKYFRPGEVS